jgi:hypothetical protein
MARVPVTVKQVLAAKVRVAGDKALKRSTPAWVVKLSQTPLPDDLSSGRISQNRLPSAPKTRARRDAQAPRDVLA